MFHNTMQQIIFKTIILYNFLDFHKLQKLTLFRSTITFNFSAQKHFLTDFPSLQHNLI